jgi:hypothetical protein
VCFGVGEARLNGRSVPGYEANSVLNHYFANFLRKIVRHNLKCRNIFLRRMSGIDFTGLFYRAYCYCVTVAMGEIPERLALG